MLPFIPGFHFFVVSNTFARMSFRGVTSQGLSRQKDPITGQALEFRIDRSFRRFGSEENSCFFDHGGFRELIILPFLCFIIVWNLLANFDRFLIWLVQFLSDLFSVYFLFVLAQILLFAFVNLASRS